MNKKFGIGIIACLVALVLFALGLVVGASMLTHDNDECMQEFTYRPNHDGTYTLIDERIESHTEIAVPSMYNGQEVTIIGMLAFSDNTTVKSVLLPNTIKELYSHAFARCSQLNTINIPNSVESIEYYCFVNCESLQYIYIPSSVKNFGYHVFYGCTSLNTIIYEGTVSQWNALIRGKDLFNNVPATHVICSDGEVPIKQTK